MLTRGKSHINKHELDILYISTFSWELQRALQKSFPVISFRITICSNFKTFLILEIYHFY